MHLLPPCCVAARILQREGVSGSREPDVHPQLLGLTKYHKNCVWTISTKLPIKLKISSSRNQSCGLEEETKLARSEIVWLNVFFTWRFELCKEIFFFFPKWVFGLKKKGGWIYSCMLLYWMCFLFNWRQTEVRKVVKCKLTLTLTKKKYHKNIILTYIPLGPAVIIVPRSSFERCAPVSNESRLHPSKLCQILQILFSARVRPSSSAARPVCLSMPPFPTSNPYIHLITCRSGVT